MNMNSGFKQPLVKKCKTYSEALQYQEENGGTIYQYIGTYGRN